jgi:hypothetical protein
VARGVSVSGFSRKKIRPTRSEWVFYFVKVFSGKALQKRKKEVERIEP